MIGVSVYNSAYAEIRSTVHLYWTVRNQLQP